MREENYREEVNFTDKQVKKDRRRDPAIDYSYEDKSSIFRKQLKSRAEKKMHKRGHVGYNDRTDKGDDDFDDYDDEKDTSKESKSSKYKTCKNCGSQMYSDAKVCPKCGNEQKKNSVGRFIMRAIFKFAIVIIVINIIIGAIAFFFNRRADRIINEEEFYSEEPSAEEPYIDYEEYSKPVKLKYIAHPKDVIKTEKEKFEVGADKELPAGEYMFVKNEGTGLGSIKIFTPEDKSTPDIFETVNRNYYVKLEDGDNVELRNGTLYKADQVQLDMSDDNNMKSGMYRLGKDVGDSFSIEGNSKTYYAILDENNIIITNGFLDEGTLYIDKEFIEDTSVQGEIAKYIQINNGILIK